MAEGVSASSLQAGFVELASIVRALHGDWSAPVAGYEGWSCKDLLAHLSSTEASLPAVVRSTSQPPRDGAAPNEHAAVRRSIVAKAPFIGIGNGAPVGRVMTG